MLPRIRRGMSGKKVSRRAVVAAGAGALLAAAAAGTWLVKRSQGTPAKALKAARVKGDLPVTDPDSAMWKQAPKFLVQVTPQRMTSPWLQEATLDHIFVRALFNGQQLGFLLEWGDEKPDPLEAVDTFRDAVAVMLPMFPDPDPAKLPPIIMGAAGKPVYILHWKASWQKDIDEGFQGVEKSFANWFNDVYPGHPDLERLGMDQEAAKVFYPGLAAGNLLSQRQRTTPVEELVAEQFGTLTPLPEQRAQGRGVFAGGRWKVSIGVPAAGADVPTLKPGQTVPVAFAVWDGAHQQRGSRKHHIPDWIPLSLPGG